MLIKFQSMRHFSISRAFERGLGDMGSDLRLSVFRVNKNYFSTIDLLASPSTIVSIRSLSFLQFCEGMF